MTAQASTAAVVAPSGAERMLVTMRVDKQLIGIPVQQVRDVLKEQQVARIPLAPHEVCGSINLRGRIVTVIDVRVRLNLPPRPEGAPHMFVVVDHQGEYYSLMVDAVGEVLTIPSAKVERSPANLAANWRDVSSGIYRLEDELLVIMDIRALLSFSEE